jgi:regulatory protein
MFGKRKQRPKFKRRPGPNDRQLREPEETKPRRPIDQEKSRTRTLQRAVKLLAAKPRSVAELRERLAEKESATEEAIEYAIGKLSEYGYLNDEQFALSFAQARVRQKPVGRGRLARDLKTKKIDKELAAETLDKVFAETPEDTLIDETIEKRIRLHGRPTTRQETKSLFDHLLRRGFSFDLIINKVRALSSQNLNEDEDGTPASD